MHTSIETSVYLCVCGLVCWVCKFFRFLYPLTSISVKCYQMKGKKIIQGMGRNTTKETVLVLVVCVSVCVCPLTEVERDTEFITSPHPGLIKMMGTG